MRHSHLNRASCSKQNIPSKDHPWRDNMLLINALSVKLDYSNAVPKIEPQSNVLCLKKAL